MGRRKHLTQSYMFSLCSQFCIESFFECLDKLMKWKRIWDGEEKMVQVVFLRKDSCDQTDKDSGKDREVKESQSDEAVDTNMEERHLFPGLAITLIPESLLKRLYEELDPPPVKDKLRCMCIGPTCHKPSTLYIVTIEEDSPLLPTDAVVADANKWWGIK